MPWILGIDEAGYGPNLGPFVMSAVACRVPEPWHEDDLWEVFKGAVRRHGDPPCSRFVVADSKLVYSPGKGLAELERSVHAASAGVVATVGDFIDLLCPQHRTDLEREAWYTGRTPVPVSAEAEACAHGRRVLADVCAALNVEWGPVRSVVVCPAAFNSMVQRWGSKGAVLAQALVQLLQGFLDTARGLDEIRIFIDKHGGRNTYAATLQPAFPDALVLAAEEGHRRSVYRVGARGRPVEIIFEPRADLGHFCVALASMVSKYLRELLMLEFNHFWQRHVPGVEPTAGYPGDSRRFWEAIRHAAASLGIADDALWRRR